MAQNLNLPDRIEYMPQTPGLRSAAEVIADKVIAAGDKQPSGYDLAMERISRLIAEDQVDLSSGDVARTLYALTTLTDISPGPEAPDDYGQLGDLLAIRAIAATTQVAIEAAAASFHEHQVGEK